MHHRDAVNQNLTAGQEVVVTNKAKNNDIHEETGKFVGYTHAWIVIDDKDHHIAITDLEIGVKHPQRLKRGDGITVRQGSKKKEIPGKSGKFDIYADSIVDICGFLYRVVASSLEVT